MNSLKNIGGPLTSSVSVSKCMYSYCDLLFLS